MKICEHCEKEFESYRQLNGHRRIHGKSNGGYSVSRKKNVTPNTYNCLNCNTLNEWSYQKTNKYCNPTCYHEWTWKNKIVPRILEGKVSNRPQLRRFLAETRGYQCDECGVKDLYNNRPLMLQVDHISGRADNDKPENLRLLCPNCHSQTISFGGRNKGNGRKALGLPLN